MPASGPSEDDVHAARAAGHLAARWRERWDRLRDWMGLPLVFVPVGERLWAAYGAPTRHYHDARHILACLDELDGFQGVVGSDDAVELALWFHDVIHDPRRGDNEARSARRYRREFGDLADGLVDNDLVEELILATRHRDPPDSGDAALVMDIDCAILGADPLRYRAYAAAIRREYGHLDDETFRAGRARFVRGLLGRDRIFWTRMLGQRLEERARANLVAELDRLCPNP